MASPDIKNSAFPGHIRVVFFRLDVELMHPAILFRYDYNQPGIKISHTVGYLITNGPDDMII